MSLEEKDIVFNYNQCLHIAFISVFILNIVCFISLTNYLPLRSQKTVQILCPVKICSRIHHVILSCHSNDRIHLTRLATNRIKAVLKCVWLKIV